MEPEGPNENITDEFRKLDIGGGSIFHYLFTRPPIQEGTYLWTYLIPWIISALLFYGLPLLVAIMNMPNNVIRDTDSGLKVGFLDDWNLIFMSLVTMPVLVILMLSERSMVPKRIAEVISGRAIYRDKKPEEFVREMNERYKRVNIIGQVVGVFAALAFFLANYRVESAPDYNGWQCTDGHLNVSGWIFLCWQLPLFIWMASVYIWQGFVTIALLFSITRNFEIKISTFHHDNCCGLRDVGQIGLRNQYLLAVAGMNLLALLAVNLNRGDPSTAHLLVAGVMAYVTLGPIVFIGPLLPFRKSMLTAKRDEQAKVANKLQDEYTRIMEELEERSMAKEDEEMIDRLQKLKDLVKRIPVWPFDISTLRKFLTVYILPFLTAVVSLIIHYIINALGD